MKPKAPPQKISKASKKPGLRDLSMLEGRSQQVKAGVRVKRTRK